jgi:transcriptional regulator with XRE-family HTH domain
MMTPDVTQLHQLRLEEGLTYRQLAEQIGLSTSALYKLIHGVTEPYETTAHRIRKYLASRAAPPAVRKRRA